MAQDWEKGHQSNIDAYDKMIKRLYYDLIKEIIRAAQSVNYDNKKPFSFSSYPTIKDRVSKLFLAFAKNQIKIITDGTRREWLIANSKNKELVDFLFEKTSLPKEVIEKMYPRNLEALRAFQTRKIGGLSLSDKIWKLTTQLRSELEMALDLGLGEGQSAVKLAQEIQKYLEEPGKLFRRVRDKHGVLHLSKNAAGYRPGQGVYRSSFKNAIRLTRTETNMAYRESDHLTYNSWDFVVGYEVRRSNNLYSCPVCEAFAGKYPKQFKFVGNHPQCRCYVVPILISDDEFIKLELMMLNDEDTTGFKSKNAITKMPAGYNDWMAENKSRFLKPGASMPYFVQNNYREGRIQNGLKFKQY